MAGFGIKSATMKTLLSLWAIAYACVAMAEAPIVTTIVNKVPGTTNYIDIPEGQAARVSALPGHHTLGYGDVWIEKDGVTFLGGLTYVYAGPARFQVRSGGLLTLERWPLVDPEKVLALPQGSNAVAVSMQSSADLIHWQTASNGVYRTTEGPKFFRLKAEK